MSDKDVLTLQDAGYLADLIRGVESGAKLRYYPMGAEDADHPFTAVMRAFTNDGGGFYSFTADVRDSHIWCSGMMERWFLVRDLIKAMKNAINGQDGLDQPMAFIDA